MADATRSTKTLPELLVPDSPFPGHRCNDRFVCFMQLGKLRVEILLASTVCSAAASHPGWQDHPHSKTKHPKNLATPFIFSSACFLTKGLTTPFRVSHLSCPQVYICGGFDGDQCLSSAEVFNPTTNQWSLIAPMSSRRSGVGVMAYGNQVYAVRANTTQHCSPLGGCSS